MLYAGGGQTDMRSTVVTAMASAPLSSLRSNAGWLSGQEIAAGDAPVVQLCHGGHDAQRQPRLGLVESAILS
jgi:hypothetical protein